MDNQRVTLLELIDFSVALDTVGHQVLLTSDLNLALECLGQHLAALNHTSLVNLSASVLEADAPTSLMYLTVTFKVHASVPYCSQYTLASCLKYSRLTSRTCTTTQMIPSFIYRWSRILLQTEALVAMEECFENIRAWMAVVDQSRARLFKRPNKH